MRPVPETPVAPRALGPVRSAQGDGPAGILGPSPPSRAAPPRGISAGRVLVAGLALSALGHAVLALWLVRAPAQPPPDGPEVPATEVSLMSGAQFSALTAPPPALPPPAPQAPRPVAVESVPLLLPSGRAPALGAARPAQVPLPAIEAPPDLAAPAVPGPDPQIAVLPPEMTAPSVSDAGAPAVRPAPRPAKPSPIAPEAPRRADAGPAAPGAAPPPPQPAGPKLAAPQAPQKPASQAGDGGRAETTRARAAGSADARDGWLSAIRARIERRKAYPAAAGAAEGRVTLQLTVDRAGRLTAVGVAQSSGHPVLDAAALRAVKSAGRFPKAPKEVTEASATFKLPLRYSAGS